jgi:hypothetical protein
VPVREAPTARRVVALTRVYNDEGATGPFIKTRRRAVAIAIVIVLIVLGFAIRATLLWRVRRRPGAPRRSKRSYSDPG